MSPADRRFVHIALKERPDVITASEGKEPDRFVVIWPPRTNDPLRKVRAPGAVI